MRKRKVLKLSIFIILIYIINIISNGVYKRFIMGNSAVMRTQIQFEQFKFNIEYLIIGDSHPQHAIDTRIIENSFNLSVAAETYIYSYYKLKYILDNNLKEIQNIIMNIDPHSFTSRRSNRIPIPFNYYYSDFIDYVELGNRKKKILTYFGEYLKGKYFSFVDSRKNIYEAIKGKQRGMIIYNGFIPSKKNYAIAEQKKIAKGRVRNQMFKTCYLDEDMMFYFKKIINMANRYGINIILIKMPLSQKYFEEAERYLDIPDFYIKIKHLIIGKKGVFLLDAQKDFFGQPHLFGDCDHLNEKGAKKLSLKLKHFLIGLKDIKKSI